MAVWPAFVLEWTFEVFWMPKRDEVAINAVRQEFLKAYNDGNAAALAACCSDDVVQLPPHEPAVRGQQAISARYQAQFDTFNCRLSTTTEELQILEQWAFAWGHYEIALKPRGDGATIQDSGKYIAIFRRASDGSWRFARDMFNSDNPPPSGT